MAHGHSLAFDNWPDRVRSVTVVMAPGCNRHCDYCPQLDRYRGAPAGPQPGARIDPGVLRNALGEAVARSGTRLDVVFTGGEPLRAANRILDAVDELREHESAEKRISFRMYTNGELLTEPLVEALLARGVTPRLSCPALTESDPHPKALDRLAKAIGLLHDARERHPDFELEAALVVRPSMVGRIARKVEWLLEAALVVRPSMVGRIARKVEWLLEAGADSVGLSPVLGAPAAHEPYDRDLLLDDMIEVAAVDSRHRARTGRTGVPLLSMDLSPAPPVPGFLASCTASDPRDITVDVDGKLVGCALFAPSVNPGGAPDGELMDRRWMRGADGRSCMSCAARPFCVPCLWEQWQESEPNEIPRFRCEFHLAALKIIEFRHQLVSIDSQRSSCTSSGRTRA